MDVFFVKLDRATAKRIKSLRITARESYDEILNRLLFNIKNNKEE